MSEYRAWCDILEHLGPTENWGPSRADYRAAFWRGDLSYSTRLKIMSFCYQNGVDHDVPLQFMKARNTDKHKILKMRQLYDYWNHEQLGQERRSKYWAYEIYSGAFCDLNGKPRPGQERYYLI